MEDRNIKFPHREIYLSLQIKEVHEKNKKQIIIKKTNIWTYLDKNFRFQRLKEKKNHPASR